MIVQVDAAAFMRLSNMLGAAGAGARHAIRRAINHTGDRAKTQMIRALTAQTGLKRGVIVRALRVTRAAHGGALDGAGSGALSYAIRSKGGNIALKHFRARETRAGVSAAPLGRRQVFAGTFIKGGAFPKRVALSKGGGHVFRRVAGARRLPVEKVRSGVFIPEQMTEGATADAFHAMVNAALPARMEHELGRIIG